MSDMKDKLIQAMNPTIAIKVIQLSNTKFTKLILDEINSVLKYKYETMIDKEMNTIYIGKRN
uniref:Uncharacterized protein n=1 Tax=viral metagenome TaxID=1070528 RepID=A0A6M3IVA1_9ZZZZ